MDGYVLIVDDNADARDLMEQMLTSMEIPARLAEDGDQALKMVREEKPRLILLDLMMPGMNGFTVISHLQKDPATRDIPVIVLSSLDVANTNLAHLPAIYHTIQKGSSQFLEIRKRISEILGPEDHSDSDKKTSE